MREQAEPIKLGYSSLYPVTVPKSLPPATGIETELDFTQEPLLRSTPSPRTGNDTRHATLFLHGIAGDPFSSWGHAGEAGTFLYRYKATFPEVDVFSCGYRADIDSILDDHSLVFPRLVQEWRTLFTEAILADYRIVTIVGYCMGGTIASFAIRQMIHDRALPTDLQVNFVMLEPLHSLPAPEVMSDWSAQLASALCFERVEFDAHVAFWRDHGAFGYSGSPVRSIHAVVGCKEGFIAMWQPHFNLGDANICNCSLDHEGISCAPRSGQFLPLDVVVERQRIFTRFLTQSNDVDPTDFRKSAML